MQIIQLDFQGFRNESGRLKRMVRVLARNILFRKDLNITNLYAGTLWAVLQKNDSK